MERWEVILEAGLEGGSITLYGLHNGKSWIFSEDICDQTPELIDEPGIFYRSKPVYSWQEALHMLDKYPWHRFSPLTVHSLFRGAVLVAVLRRSKPEEITSDGSIRSWFGVCGEIPYVEYKLVL